tara:strand:- start:1532 stop:1951 length:420 start_codon:yes stop_codon:yes gene_type:complete
MAIDNNIELAGNLVADPELRHTKSGAAILNARMAVNRRWNKDGEWQEETSFIDVTAWAELAENCKESLSKGMRVVVTGRIEEQTWDDKETGEPRRKVVVIADELSPSLRYATVEVTKIDRKGGPPSATNKPTVSPEEPF